MLVCWRGLAVLVPVPGRLGRPVDRDHAEVVGEVLQRVAGLERDVERGRGRPVAVAQAEGVVEELAPGPAPLGDPALGEHVLVRGR